jgi:hypothetical protein
VLCFMRKGCLYDYSKKMIVIFLIPSSLFCQNRINKKNIFRVRSSTTYTNNLSASYTNYKNWKYSGYNNFSFLLRSNINYDTTGKNWETHIRFNGELGYMKFVDSTWYKNSDYLDVGADLVKNTNKRLENVFSFNLNSQFLSAYEMYYNDSGTYARRWTSGFCNPLNIDLGYGTTLHFWKTCRLNLTFVTLRTSTMPVLDPGEDINGNDMIYRKTKISSEYGLGIQTFIKKNIGNRLRWENYSRAFANAVNREKFDIDFRNRFVLKIFKYLDFIVDSRIRYMPYPPYHFQFRNELMLSFTFEKI